jgi:hypothetical protein
LDATAAASYGMIDQMMSDLKFDGKCWYIPPYPKNAYLPEHLKGLQEMIVFISAEQDAELPSIEEIASRRFILQDSRGLDITAPGAGLLDQLENELKLDLTQIDLQTLCETLPQQILENFQLAREIEMKPEDDSVNLKITGSIFRSLYVEKRLKSVYILGCPLVSALACALAETIGKAVTINALDYNPETDTTEASCSTEHKITIYAGNLTQEVSSPKPERREDKSTQRWRTRTRTRSTKRWRTRSTKKTQQQEDQ